MESITLDEVLNLLSYPKKLGDHNGKELKLNKKYGLYLTYDGKNYPTANESISLGDAIKILIRKIKIFYMSLM